MFSSRISLTQSMQLRTIKSLIIIVNLNLKGYTFFYTHCMYIMYIQGRSEGGIGGLTPPPTFLELTYSENQVGHSENYGNNSITKF